MNLPYERRLSSMRPEGPVSYQGYWNDFVRFLNETVDGDDVYVAVPLKRRGADGASRVANLIRTTLRRRGVEGWRVMTDPDGTGIWVHRSGPPGGDESLAQASVTDRAAGPADEGSSVGTCSCGPALRAAVEPRGWRLDEPSCLHDESCPSFRRNGHRYVLPSESVDGVYTGTCRRCGDEKELRPYAAEDRRQARRSESAVRATDD